MSEAADTTNNPEAEAPNQDPSQPEQLNKNTLRSLNMYSATSGERYKMRPYIVYLNPQDVEGAKLSFKAQLGILLFIVVLAMIAIIVYGILKAFKFID